MEEVAIGIQPATSLAQLPPHPATTMLQAFKISRYPENIPRRRAFSRRVTTECKDCNTGGQSGRQASSRVVLGRLCATLQTLRKRQSAKSDR